MTATMPDDLIDRFDYLSIIDFINNDVNTKKLEEFQQQTLNRPHLNKRSLEWYNKVQCYQEDAEGHKDSIGFQSNVTQLVLKEWNTRGEKGRILAVVQTVKDAVAIYQQLKSELGCDTSADNRWLFLYHGRIADQHRPNLYQQIKQRDNDEQSYIVVTTSAIEVGCDLNAEVLISQICPPENLIQRAGRCNRKGNVPNAKVILVGDRISEFANSLDDEGWNNYQETLQQLTTFDTQKIGEHIRRSQHIDDYRVVELFSMLHDYVYGADLTCQPIHEKGLVITRSWTPSATLVYDNGKQGTGIDSISKMPQTTVPIDRFLIRKKDEGESNQYANTSIYERYYDQEQTRWDLRPLRWGVAYSKDIVIKLGPYSDGAFMPGEGNQYEYKEELGFFELPRVFIRLSSTGFEEKLLCKHRESDGQKSAIITYTKALSDELKP